MNKITDLFSNPAPALAIAVTSGKGGVGKTSVAINLGVALRRMKRSVMLLDADLGLANVDVLLGLNPRYNLSHVIRGECSLEDVVIDGPEGLLIVPAGSGIQEMAELSSNEHAGLINAFNELKRDIDTLIVDTAAGINKSVLNFCQAASEVLVVINDEPTSLTDSYGLIKVLAQDYAVKRFHVLTNRVDNSADGFLLYQRLLNTTDQFLNIEIKYLGAIPQDKYVRQANQQQKLLLKCYPQSMAAHAFKDVAKRVSEWYSPETASGGMEFFLERLINQSTAA